MTAAYVLDASALLAWLNGEVGGEKVEPLLGVSVISTVNLSETIQKSLVRGVDVEGLVEDLRALGLGVASFSAEEAEIAAWLWPKTRKSGLSLADRACLALARRLDVPAVTADRDWKDLEGKKFPGGFHVQLIR